MTTFIISNNYVGGSEKYIKDLISHYPQTKIIRNKNDLFSTPFKEKDTLMIQQLFFTGIYPNDLITIKRRYSVRIIICIHDFCWFSDTEYESIYLKSDLFVPFDVISLFSVADFVIHPSYFTKQVYNCIPHRSIVQPHNDIILHRNTKKIGPIHDEIIVGVPHAFSDYKGKENILHLMNYTEYKGFKLKFSIVGVNEPYYNEDNYSEFYKNVHCLLHLNKWGETYCYTLTKSLNSGLPLLYNNIGAFKERIPQAEHYFKVIENETEYYEMNKLTKTFETMLDYIIENNGKYDTSYYDTTIQYHDFYNYVFESKSPYHILLNPTLNKLSLYQPEKHEEVAYDTIHADDILITRRYLSNKCHEHLEYKIDNNILDILEEFILVLDFGNGGGGTTFFINTIVSIYKKNQSFVIARNFDNMLHLNINEEYDLSHKYSEAESILFLQKYKHKISKIFINHLLNHSTLFINELHLLQKEIITITHDYYNICRIPQPYFHEIQHCRIKPRINPTLSITQNKENCVTFKNQKILEIPDFKKNNVRINTTDIVVAILGNINTLKGETMLKKIIQNYKNTNVRVIVIGYTEIDCIYYNYNSIHEFNTILSEQKPTLLLELSIWPETYSYTLSLCMLTTLPILCFKKNFNSVIEKRLESYPNKYYFSNLSELNELIATKGQPYLFTIEPVIYYNREWNDIFLTKIKKKIHTSPFKHDIKPYFIYFPQFHKIKENDLLFYEGFSDMNNLKLYNNNAVKLDTPLLEYLNIKDMDEYDLTNSDIIQKQIDVIDSYNYSGIALYYYWFSENTISGDHHVMKEVVDQFFKGLNMKRLKTFFIWANENWTDNLAFGINEKSKMINEYTEENYIKNANYLVEYFKHDNYLKIERKPVFFIYHTYLIENIELFRTILNDTCIKHKFDGVTIVVNSFLETPDTFDRFYINFNYKKYHSRYIENKQHKLNYKDYLDTDYHFKENCIHTIVTDFNNKPRLYKPDRIEHSTVCVNNTEINKIAFIKKVLRLYEKNKSELGKILLVNSFNEWGENMAFEPSEKYQYYNLNLLQECLIHCDEHKIG